MLLNERENATNRVGWVSTDERMHRWEGDDMWDGHNVFDTFNFSSRDNALHITKALHGRVNL